VDAERLDRLRARVAECDEVVAENRDSPDPVAQRRLREALWAKGAALAELGRHAEGVEVWDEMLAQFADDPQDGDERIVGETLFNKALDLHQCGRREAALATLDQLLAHGAVLDDDGYGYGYGPLIAARALTIKRDVLVSAGRFAEAVRVDDEIIGRFATATEPELRSRVASTLRHRAHLMLRGRRINEALADGAELVRRFDVESDPGTVGEVGEFLLSHARSLLHLGSPTFQAVLGQMTVTLGGAVGQGSASVARRLRLDRAPGVERWGDRLRRTSAARWVSRRHLVVTFTEKRRRAEAALLACRAVIDRFDGDELPDRRQTVDGARILEAEALMLLGHLQGAFHRFDELIGSGQESVAEAFRARARLSSHERLTDEIAAVAALAHRARTLGNGDTRIARIAFEESLRPGQPGSPDSRAAQWIARLLGP
jgi:tetratricopeptide (TPR) repeat protein